MTRGRCVSAGILVILLMSGCQGPLHKPGELARADRDRTPALKPSEVADVQLAFARTLERQGDLEKARATYAEVLAKAPSCVDALERLAVLSDRQGQFKESESLYLKALAARPNDANLHCNRGYSLYLQQRWTESERCLRRALELDPSNNRSHNNLGLVLVRLGRGNDALREFRLAGCSESDAQTNLACGLLLAGACAEARGCFEKALAINPADAVARKGLQNLLALQEKTASQPKLIPDGKDTNVSAEFQDSKVVQTSYSAPLDSCEPRITSVESLSSDPSGFTRRSKSVSRWAPVETPKSATRAGN